MLLDPQPTDPLPHCEYYQSLVHDGFQVRIGKLGVELRVHEFQSEDCEERATVLGMEANLGREKVCARYSSILGPLLGGYLGPLEGWVLLNPTSGRVGNKGRKGRSPTLLSSYICTRSRRIRLRESTQRRQLQESSAR